MATTEPKNKNKSKNLERLNQAIDTVARLEANAKAMEEKLKEYAASNEQLKAQLATVDLTKIRSAIESRRVQIKDTVRAIQRASAIQVPGLDDEVAKNGFSIVKACIAAKTNGQKCGDTKEWEAMKAMQKAASTIGLDGWWLGDQVVADVIEPIYGKSQFVALDGDGNTRCSLITGLVGASVRIPKITSGCIAYWNPELGKTLESKAGTAEVNMKPNKLSVLTRISEEQTRFSTGMEQFIRRDMIKVAVKEVDRVIPYGTGDNNEPKGITKYNVNRYYAETKSSTAPGGTPVGGVLDYTGLSNMDLAMEDQNIEADETFATISSPAFFRYLANRRVLNYSGQAEADADYLAGLPPFTRARMKEIIGEYGWTTKIASNKSLNSVAKFTDVFRGNFGELVVAMWSGIEIVTEDGFDIVNDSRRIKLRLWMDTALRQDAALSWCSDAQARS